MGVTIESNVVFSVSMRKRFGRMNLFSGFRFKIGRQLPTSFLGTKKKVDMNPVRVPCEGTTRIARFWRREVISPSRELRLATSDGTGVGRKSMSDGGVLENSIA